jgi:predicted DNA-binding protein with PD1-like motif
MKSAEMTVGRVFILRLETGEVIHEVLEKFAKDNGISYATVSIVGGVAGGSKMVSGPTLPIGKRIIPIVHSVESESEVTGFGTIVPDESGQPYLHMHGSVGREGKSSTGCFRAGMIAWLVLEAVVTELIGKGPVRKTEPLVGFKVLQIED